MNKLSLVKLLLISTMLFTAMSYADENFRYSELPKIQHPETACINAPLKENCTGIGATYYPWTSSYYVLWKKTQQPLTDPFRKILEGVTKNVWSDDFRQELVKHDPVVWSVQGKGQRMDYNIQFKRPSEKDSYGTYYWMRSFEGISPGDTVYLVAFYHGCDNEPSMPSFTRCVSMPIPEIVADEDIDEAMGNATEEDFREATLSRVSLSARLYNLRAYRYENNQLVDATDRVLPALSSLVLSPQDFTYYAQRGFSGIELDLSKLDRVPIFRLESNFDYPPDRETEEYRYQDNRMHFGYVVWDGKKFDLTQWVHRDLWPCEREEGATSCRKINGDDFFVYDDNTVLEIHSDDGYTNLRSQPSAQGKVLTKLPNKTRLVIIESQGDWLKVEALYRHAESKF